MSRGRLRVVFMGSPPIAVATLEALVERFDVALAVTQPERPGGRGRHPRPTAVAARARELGVEVFASENVNSDAAAARIAEAEPEAIVVVSFGQLLGRALLRIPTLGCLNVHFSLLPKLRGAAPVAWAIMEGHAETGVSIIKMVRRMDAGPVYARRAEAIRGDDTYTTLSERLSRAGAELLVETLERHAREPIEPEAQDESAATFAPKITRETGAVDWTRRAEEVDRLVRGLSGQLEAYAYVEAKGRTRVTLYHTAVWSREGGGGPGIAARGPAGELVVGCGEGAVEIREIQAEGRRRVCGRDFANGYHISGGERFVPIRPEA